MNALARLAAIAALASTNTELTPLTRADLCTTLGDLLATPSGRLEVRASKMRAVAPLAGRDAAELRFKYLGPTEQTSALGSGEVRQQLGLKLRAEDGCNLLYVMWRLAPASSVVVQVKRNPGARTHRECGNRGYHRLRAERSAEVPAVAVGSEHRLKASVSGSRLTVEADGTVAWEGTLDTDAAALQGPVGVRSDNVHAEIDLRAPTTGNRPACGSKLELGDE